MLHNLFRSTDHAVRKYSACHSTPATETGRDSKPCENSKALHPVKQEGKVHMDTVPRGGIQQDIFPMPIAQAHDVAHHGPHSSGSGEGQAGSVPGGRLRESGQEPAMQHGWVTSQHLI